MSNSEPRLPIEIKGIKSTYVKLGTIPIVVRAEGTTLAKGFFQSVIFWSSMRQHQSQVLFSTY